MFCSVLFFSRPRSEGWPHHGRTFSIYLYPLSFWLTLPQRVLSTTLCCLSRPCVVFLACIHLALFLALFLSPGSSLVSSWCDHSINIKDTDTTKHYPRGSQPGGFSLRWISRFYSGMCTRDWQTQTVEYSCFSRSSWSNSDQCLAKQKCQCQTP